ncbi:hypothetical protein ALC56_01339 [Trachymyrmex septentrionalis]|uniref:Uncharacterized protein n=1 Tax=Trachymyrmex septentrionalis TaxID=34720 RepID=A0A151K0T2_9HYME|nr:hypothetical protein ALC56_01339 [Trachymyrmex septentrionalis]
MFGKFTEYHFANVLYFSARVPCTAKCIQITEAAKSLWLRKMNGDRRQKYRRALSVAECGGVPNKIREVKVTQVNSKTILVNQMPRSICSAKCVSTLTINEIYFTEIYPYLIHVLRKTTARKKTHHREHDVNDSMARRRKRDTSPLPGFLSSRRSVSRARRSNFLESSGERMPDPFRSYATEGDEGRRSFWIVLKWVVAREVSQLCPERDALTNQLPWGGFSSPSGSSSGIFRLSQTQIFPRSRHLPSALSAYTSPLAFVCVCIHVLLQLFIYRIYHSFSKCKQIHVKDDMSLSMTTSLIGLERRREGWGPIKITCWRSLRVMTLTTYIKITGGSSPKQNVYLYKISLIIFLRFQK